MPEPKLIQRIEPPQNGGRIYAQSSEKYDDEYEDELTNELMGRLRKMELANQETNLLVREIYSAVVKKPIKKEKRGLVATLLGRKGV